MDADLRTAAPRPAPQAAPQRAPGTPPAHLTERRPLLAGAALFAASALLLLAFHQVPALHFTLAAGPNAAVHTVLEVASVTVSLMVFAMGWATYDRNRESVVPVVSAVFLAAAILDTVHLLSYTGMPELVTPSSTGKAIPTFLAARLLVALAMLGVAFLPARPARVTALRALLLAGSLAVALAASWLGVSSPAFGRLFFDPDAGLTRLKVGIDHALVGLHLLATARLAVRLREAVALPVADLLGANALMALSEFCFTLYANTADQYINVGHVIKILAYVLVWRAMFRDALLRPYQELARAQQDLVALNAQLEERVRERTARMEAANRDLEAFSYTVAHDLRAPIGVIEGFCSVLAARIGQRLEPGERHFLDRIRAGAVSMSGMVDGLLVLSGISRSAVAPVSLDLAAIAREVASECRAREPSRDVEVWVPDRLPVQGDARLLQLLLANLIGNAWKFTARSGRACVEVGSQTGAKGETVYFVRDNGAGFDAGAASRLGQPFERFHTQAEFEGHGIGLATASRIVALHGGRLWADSRPGQGATFFFTLASA